MIVRLGNADDKLQVSKQAMTLAISSERILQGYDGEQGESKR